MARDQFDHEVESVWRYKLLGDGLTGTVNGEVFTYGNPDTCKRALGISLEGSDRADIPAVVKALRGMAGWLEGSQAEREAAKPQH